MKPAERSPQRAEHTSRSRSPRPRDYASASTSARTGSRSPERSSNRYPRRMHSPAPPSTCVGVFGLSQDTKEDALRDTFCAFGQVSRLELVKDRVTGESRRFAFVYYDSVEQATEARDKTNGMTLHGRRLRVDFSKTNGPHNPTPGQYAGRSSGGGGERGRSRSPSSHGRYHRGDRRSPSPCPTYHRHHSYTRDRRSLSRSPSPDRYSRQRSSRGESRSSYSRHHYGSSSRRSPSPHHEGSSGSSYHRRGRNYSPSRRD